MRASKKSHVGEVAFAQKPVDISKEHYNNWQRQRGAVGIYYEDPSLKSVSAVPRVGDAEFSAAAPVFSKPRPDSHALESHGKFHFGRLQSSEPETELLPQNNQFLQSRVGLWSEMNGTEHPGHYLSARNK